MVPNAAAPVYSATLLGSTTTYICNAGYGKSGSYVINRTENRTEQNLFKTCTKYIIFFIYNITNIVMSCDKYTETERQIITSQHCEIKNMCEDEQKGL